VAGPFPTAFFAPDFVGPLSRTFSKQLIRDNGDGTITTCYPAGSSGPGTQAKLLLAAGPLDGATLTYQVRFPVGFQFVLGGKLPGLCGGQCWTGSHNGPGGWTTRFMWRTNGVGEVLLSDATTTMSGLSLGRGSWTFLADDQWHTLSQTIHLNTPGLADGTIDVSYNGVHVAQFTGITFRTDATTRIDGLMFCTFYGGGGPSWAPSVITHIDYEAFSLTAA
jgi:hypothetical protein